MIKKIIRLSMSVLLVLCVVCCVYLFFFDKAKDGEDGLNGADGRDGIDGAQWFVRDGIPAPDLGKTGDCYFDLNSNSLYQKENDGWKLLGVLHQDPPATEEITITFDAGEGELADGEKTRTLQKGTNCTLPIPKREGFDFLGWFLGEGANSAQANDLTVFTRGVTLVARWQKHKEIELESAEANEKVGKIVSFQGNYSGSAAIVLYIERDGSLLNLTEAEEIGWIGSTEFHNSTDGTGGFSGYVQFTEVGEYHLIFRAEEPNGVVEAQMHVVIS